MNILGFLRRKPLLEVIPKPEPSAEPSTPAKAGKPKPMVRDAAGNIVASHESYSKLLNQTEEQINLSSVFKESFTAKTQYEFAMFKTAIRGTDAEMKAGLFHSSQFIYAKPSVPVKNAVHMRIPCPNVFAPDLIKECIEFAGSYGYVCSDTDHDRLVTFFKDSFLKEAGRVFRQPKGAACTFRLCFYMPAPEGVATKVVPQISLTIVEGLPRHGGTLNPSDTVASYVCVNLHKEDESKVKKQDISPTKQDDDGSQTV